MTPETVIGGHTGERASANGLDEGHLLLGLRRSLPLQMLNGIPAPLGFKPARNAEGPSDDDSQHEMGSDGEIAGRYGPALEGEGSQLSHR